MNTYLAWFVIWVFLTAVSTIATDIGEGFWKAIAVSVVIQIILAAMAIVILVVVSAVNTVM